MAIYPVPQMPSHMYTTYSIKAPAETHFRRATCQEVDCPDYVNGWKVRVEILSAELLHAAKTSGRKYRVLEVSENETWLVYEAGQQCFHSEQHKTRMERPELFLVRGGDFRGNPHGVPTRIHDRPEDWMEDLHEHTDALAEALKEG